MAQLQPPPFGSKGLDPLIPVEDATYEGPDINPNTGNYQAPPVFNGPEVNPINGNYSPEPQTFNGPDINPVNGESDYAGGSVPVEGTRRPLPPPDTIIGNARMPLLAPASMSSPLHGLVKPTFGGYYDSTDPALLVTGRVPLAKPATVAQSQIPSSHTPPVPGTTSQQAAENLRNSLPGEATAEAPQQADDEEARYQAFKKTLPVSLQDETKFNSRALWQDTKHLEEAQQAKQHAQQGEAAATEAGKAEIARVQGEQALRAQQIADNQKKLYDIAQAKIQTRVDRAKTEKFTNFYDDKTIGQKILYALSLMAGSVSWEAHHDNPVAKMLHDQIQLHFEQQKERKAEIWKQIDRDISSGRALHEDQLQELANFKANQAAQLQAVITKAEFLSSKAKSATGAAALQEEIAKFKLEQQQKQAEAAKAQAAADETKNYHQQEIKVKYDANNAVREAAGVNAGSSVAGGATPEEKMIDDHIQKNYKDPLIGTSSAPGLIYGRDQTASIVKEAKAALKTGDPEKMAIAATHIREQSSRLLTHTGLTNMTLEQQKELSGFWDKLATEVDSTIHNKPTVGRRTFVNLIRSIDGIRAQQDDQIKQAHDRFQREYYGDASQGIPGIARTQAQIEKAKAQEYALFGKGTGTSNSPVSDPRDKTRQKNNLPIPGKYSPSKDPKVGLSQKALKDPAASKEDKDAAKAYLKSKGLGK